MAPSGKEATRRAIGRENATMQSFSSSIKQPSSNTSEGLRMWSGYMKKEQGVGMEQSSWQQEPVPSGKACFSKQVQKLAHEGVKKA